MARADPVVGVGAEEDPGGVPGRPRWCREPGASAFFGSGDQRATDGHEGPGVAQSLLGRLPSQGGVRFVVGRGSQGEGAERRGVVANADALRLRELLTERLDRRVVAVAALSQ